MEPTEQADAAAEPAEPAAAEAIAKDSTDGMVAVLAQTLGGEEVQLAPLHRTALVADLAREVREKLGFPIATQNLLWGDQPLANPRLGLAEVFGGASDVQLTVAQRQMTRKVAVALHTDLVRAAAAGNKQLVGELLKEGAELELADYGDEGQEPDHAGAASSTEEGGEEEDSGSEFDSDDPDHQGTRPRLTKRAMSFAEKARSITPLMMAIAAGEEDIADDLRRAGAPEPAMEPVSSTMAQAFSREDFLDIVRHIAAGADVNVRLSRREGIRGTSSGVPLHACCAMHHQQGAYEVTQLLIRKKADLSRGDCEGDTPLAHARYFGATEIYKLLEGEGAEIAGPFFRGVGER